MIKNAVFCDAVQKKYPGKVYKFYQKLTIMKEFYKKNILITGGTGSFGQSAVEYLLKHSELNK